MNKKITQLAAIIFVLLYLSTSFIKMTFNPIYWSEEVRVMFIIAYFSFFLIAAIIVFITEPNEK